MPYNARDKLPATYYREHCVADISSENVKFSRLPLEQQRITEKISDLFDEKQGR